MKLFQLTRNERLGLVGAILVFSVLSVVKYYNSKIEIAIIPGSFEETTVSEPELNLDSSSFTKKNISSFPVKEQPPIIIKAFETFNPNNVEEQYWLRLGFSQKMASRIFKFVNSGKKLSESKELAIVYGMDPNWLNAIKDSILIPVTTIDVNTATTEEFKALKGIGIKLAGRIVKFRDALGGFYTVNQLSQVYGIDSNIVELNSQYLTINKQPKKMDVKRLGLKEMKSHPYLDGMHAEEIIRLRSVYDNLDSSQLSNIFTTGEWEKVKPYLLWKH